MNKSRIHIMTRTLSLASRLREVLLNGKWIANTNFKEQIEHVDWEQAIRKVENLNTIALLSFHINYYLAGILNVFKAGKLQISDRYSFDLPAITSAAGWDQLVNEFLGNAEQFIKEVEQMEDDRLDQPFVDEKYGTWLRNIEGVIEHSYYHLGQVVLIKKMITLKQ